MHDIHNEAFRLLRKAEIDLDKGLLSRTSRTLDAVVARLATVAPCGGASPAIRICVEYYERVREKYVKTLCTF